MDKSKSAYRYQGYKFLNRQLMFRGGISAELAQFILIGSMLSLVLLIFLLKIFAVLVFPIAIAVALPKIKKYADENKRGDRDAIKTFSAWSKTPQVIEDDTSVFIQLIENADKFE